MRKPGKKIRKNPPENPPDTTGAAAEASLWSDPFVHLLLVLVLGFAVYSNTIYIPFTFDDYPCLVNNPAIRDFSFFSDLQKVFTLGINSDLKHNFVLRPVAYFTFAVNYALHGTDVRGYHLVNLLLHLGNAILVYLLVRLTLRTPALCVAGGSASDQPAEKYPYLPLLASLLFVCHPLQTQAVSYIVQRFVPLVAFFYLGALVLYVNGRLAQQRSTRIACYAFALLACICAMKTKENGFTLPVVLGLYEFIFFDGKVTARLVRLIPFQLTMAIIPLKLMELSSRVKPADAGTVSDAVNLVNFSGTSSWDYLMTQFGVITTYLRLLFLPINQNFDYDYPLQRDFFTPAVLLPLVLLLAIVAGGVWLFLRSRERRNPKSGLYAMAAFGIFWFFIALAVESSIVPIDDVIFEHRAYLPSVGFFMATLAGAASVCTGRAGRSPGASRLAVALLALLVCSYATAGFLRNRVWESRIALWRDVVDKSPNKGRSHLYLGLALAEQMQIGLDDETIDFKQSLYVADKEQVEEAVQEFRSAIKLEPNSDQAHLCLGVALLQQKKYDEAASELSAAVALNPTNFQAHVKLGKIFEAKRDLANARREYLKSIAIAPTAPSGHRALGALEVREGNYADALKEYEIVLLRAPDNDVRKKIANLKGKLGLK